MRRSSQVACGREGGRAAQGAPNMCTSLHARQPAPCLRGAAQHVLHNMAPKRARPTCAAAEAGTPWSCTYARGRPGPPAPLHPCAQRWHPQATARGCLLGRSPPPAHTRARARARTAHAVYDRCTAWQASRACGLDGGNHCYVHRYAPAH